MQRIRDCRVLRPKWDTHIASLSPRLKDQPERGDGKIIQEPEVVDDSKERVFSKLKRVVSLINASIDKCSAVVTACIRPEQDKTRHNCKWTGRAGYKSPGQAGRRLASFL